MDNSYSYLNTPSKSTVAPPVETSTDELPIEKLAWEDFERLCLRIVGINYSMDDCEIYGTKGQKQEGIDIFARKDNAKYACFQCKRYQEMTEAGLDKLVDEFKNGEWFGRSEEFIICTTASLNTTQLQDKVEGLKNTLEGDGVSLTKWDKVQLSRLLKGHPQIVYDFFGKEWTKQFNGEEQLSGITRFRRLDANAVVKYRTELHKVYSTVFQQYDPGIPSQELDNFACLIQERFIVPDILEERSMNESAILPKDREELNDELREQELEGAIDSKYSVRSKKRIDKEYRIQRTTVRTSVDSILAKEKRTIVIGDPGSGKSTLLRYVVLDLLSDRPKLQNISQQWGTYLPIWLPFAYVTKNLSADPNLNLSELLRKWFKSIDRESLFDIVKDAIHDERLLLIVDGIDEWTNASVAQQTVSKLEIQSELSKATIVYSSRPYGYRLLEDAFSNIKELKLAPFSEGQQRQYIHYWYRKWIDSIENADPERAQSETDNFLTELDKSSEFKPLAENPLLLSILIAQRFKNAALPRSRLKALEDITDQLISKHPIRRRAAANIIDHDELDFELDQIFSELAIYIQKNSHEGVVLKSDAQKVIENFLVDLMGYETPKARKASKELLDIGANSIGIIIEKSTDEIAFMHRQFQEFLAAKYLLQSDRSEVIQVLNDFSQSPTWHQVAIAFFGLIPHRKSQDFEDYLNVVKAKISTDAIASYPMFLAYELSLNLSNAPITIAKESLSGIVQKFDYETNKSIKDILWRIILESIHNTKIKNEVRHYLFKFFPNYYQFNDYRVGSLKSLNLSQIGQAQKEFLLKSLINGNSHQKLDASNTIKYFIGDKWLLNKVCEVLDRCFNPNIVSYALNCIIADTVSDTVKLRYLKRFQSTEHPDVALFVVKLKVHTKMHKGEELPKVVEILKRADYTLKDEVLNILVNGWPESEILLEMCLESVSRVHYGRSIDTAIAWAILFHCFNHKEVVIKRMVKEITDETYPFGGADDHNGWPYIANYFKDNENLIPVIDDWIIKQKFPEPEVAYASLVGRTDRAKKHMMNNLSSSTFPHWYVMALTRGWEDDLEAMAFLQDYFKGSSKKKAYAADGISVVFKNKKQEGIEILETILFDREINVRGRAINPLIELDSDYFESNILGRLLDEELVSFPSDIFSDYYGAVDTIVKSYKNLPQVKEFALANLKNTPEGIDILMQSYAEEVDVVEHLTEVSQPLSIDYRLQLIYKLIESSSIESVVSERLASYDKESEDILKLTAAIGYFNYLKHRDINKILSRCKDKVFYRGHDYRTQRQIAFCGYLIAKKLSEYLELKDQDSSNLSSPNIMFEDTYKKMSPLFIKTLVNNFRIHPL